MKLAWVTLFAAIAIGGAAVPSVARGDQMTIDQVPAKARATLVREAHGYPIRRVELDTQSGKTVYEGVIQQGDKEVAIAVDAQGNVRGRHSETANEKYDHNK
jgi:hypothetical protein